MKLLINQSKMTKTQETVVKGISRLANELD